MTILKNCLLLSLLFSTILSAITQQACDTGAGVLLIEQYADKGKRKPALILFKSKATGKYEDPGGKRDKKENLRDTAARELKEESCNLFTINKNKLSDGIAVKIKNTYICYALLVQGPKDKGGYPVYRAHYQTNVRLLAKQKAPHAWLETDDMTRVYVDQLVKDKAHAAYNRLVTTDVYGKKITIEGRAVACIRECIKQKVVQKAIARKPVILKVQKSKNRFLKGTLSYTA